MQTLVQISADSVCRDVCFAGITARDRVRKFNFSFLNHSKIYLPESNGIASCCTMLQEVFPLEENVGRISLHVFLVLQNQLKFFGRMKFSNEVTVEIF